MQEEYTLPVQDRPFNIRDAIVGVFTRPDPTMRSIAAARPWKVALVLLLGMTVLSFLVALTTPAQLSSVLGQNPGEVPPELEEFLAGTQSRWFLAGVTLISPVLSVFYTGILFLIGRMLGGQGRFSALFSTNMFASLPSVVIHPLTLLTNLTGAAALGCLTSPVSLAVSLWIIVLQVFGVRASLNLSTNRAVATVLIPIGILLFLACAAVVLFVGLAIIGLRQLDPSFGP